jgi:ribosomal protein S18 acetylase RimI-like enzyme
MDDSNCLEALPWETRNLGVASFSVRASFVANPDEKALMRALAAVQDAHGSCFVQARFTADTTVARTLAQCGFYFVETVLSPHVSLAKHAVLDRFVADPARVLPGRCALADLEVGDLAAGDHATAAAVRAIAGESFVDDRFHIDHSCDHATANRRYQLWVDDLLRDDGVRCHVLRLRTEPVGFLASRQGDLLLAAFAPRYAGAGLGEYFWLRVLQDLRLGGTKVVRTVISTNNVAALNLYVRLQFKLAAPRATFHLWARGGRRLTLPEVPC